MEGNFFFNFNTIKEEKNKKNKQKWEEKQKGTENKVKILNRLWQKTEKWR